MDISSALIIKYRGAWTYVQGSEKHGPHCAEGADCPRKRIKLEGIRMKSNRLRPNRRALFLAGKVIQWDTFKTLMETK